VASSLGEPSKRNQQNRNRSLKRRVAPVGAGTILTRQKHWDGGQEAAAEP